MITAIVFKLTNLPSSFYLFGNIRPAFELESARLSAPPKTVFCNMSLLLEVTCATVLLLRGLPV